MIGLIIVYGALFASACILVAYLYEWERGRREKQGELSAEQIAMAFALRALQEEQRGEYLAASMSWDKAAYYLGRSGALAQAYEYRREETYAKHIAKVKAVQ